MEVDSKENVISFKLVNQPRYQQLCTKTRQYTVSCTFSDEIPESLRGKSPQQRKLFVKLTSKPGKLDPFDRKFLHELKPTVVLSRYTLGWTIQEKANWNFKNNRSPSTNLEQLYDIPRRQTQPPVSMTSCIRIQAAAFLITSPYTAWVAYTLKLDAAQDELASFTVGDIERSPPKYAFNLAITLQWNDIATVFHTQHFELVSCSKYMNPQLKQVIAKPNSKRKHLPQPETDDEETEDEEPSECSREEEELEVPKKQKKASLPEDVKPPVLPVVMQERQVEAMTEVLDEFQQKSQALLKLMQELVKAHRKYDPLRKSLNNLFVEKTPVIAKLSTDMENLQKETERLLNLHK